MTGKKKKQKKAGANILSAKMQNRMGYLFMAPWLIGFIIFTGIPFFATIYLSFFAVEQNILGFSTEFVGWGNYFTALFQNLYFNPGMVGYAIMIVMYTPTVVIISFILAYFLNMKLRGRFIFRTIYFLPVIVLSGPVMHDVIDTGGAGGYMDLTGVFLFRMLYYYAPAAGNVIQMLFQNFAILLWFTGIPIVLFITGMQKINPALYEAARIDSASTWQILFKITLPLIKQTILISSIFTIAQLGMFASINPIYDLIRTSMMNTTGGLGLASAYALMFSLVTLIFIGICAILFRQKEV